MATPASAPDRSRHIRWQDRRRRLEELRRERERLAAEAEHDKREFDVLFDLLTRGTDRPRRIR